MRKKKETKPCRRCGSGIPLERTQCPSCRYINVEITYDDDDDGTFLLSDIPIEKVERIQTGSWDPCWGFHYVRGKEVHGIVNKSVTLLGGRPGAGKSTLALQLSDSIAKRTNREVIYLSGEEDDGQLGLRADRLKVNTKLVRIMPLGRLKREIGDIIRQRKCAAFVIDSLPKVCPDMGDAVEFAWRIRDYCIELSMPAIIIDHVTKEEEFAGMEELQHAVDTTLLFTVYDEDQVRELRTVKNRNGIPARLLFNMEESGLVLRAEDDEEENDD